MWRFRFVHKQTDWGGGGGDDGGGDAGGDDWGGAAAGGDDDWGDEKPKKPAASDKKAGDSGAAAKSKPKEPEPAEDESEPLEVRVSNEFFLGDDVKREDPKQPIVHFKPALKLSDGHMKELEKEGQTKYVHSFIYSLLEADPCVGVLCRTQRI